MLGSVINVQKIHISFFVIHAECRSPAQEPRLHVVTNAYIRVPHKAKAAIDGNADSEQFARALVAA